MVCDRMVIKFHLRVSERPVFGDPAFDAHAPSFKRTRRKRSAHHLNYLGLRNAQALLDSFERGSVFPGHLNEGRHVARRQRASFSRVHVFLAGCGALSRY